MADILGPRRACLARELTKMHEELLHGTLPELLENLQARPRIQGEITIVIEQGETVQVSTVFPESIKQHLDEVMKKTRLPRNEALKSVARERGISRKEAYKLLIDD